MATPLLTSLDVADLLGGDGGDDAIERPELALAAEVELWKR